MGFGVNHEYKGLKRNIFKMSTVVIPIPMLRPWYSLSDAKPDGRKAFGLPGRSRPRWKRFRHLGLEFTVLTTRFRV